MPKKKVNRGSSEIGVGWLCESCGPSAVMVPCIEAMPLFERKTCSCGGNILGMLTDTSLERILSGLESFRLWTPRNK